MDFLWQSLGYTNKIAQKYPKNTQITLSDTHTNTNNVTLCFTTSFNALSLAVSLLSKGSIFHSDSLGGFRISLSVMRDCFDSRTLYIVGRRARSLAVTVVVLSTSFALQGSDTNEVKLLPFILSSHWTFFRFCFVHQQQTLHRCT